MKRKVLLTCSLSALLLLLVTGVAYAGDPTGTSLSGKATYDALYNGLSTKDAIGHNALSINYVWTLVTAFLVMFMQAGFALVETGFCQKKNAAHVMMTNFVIYPLGILGFFLCGFAFMFGGASGIASLGGTAPLNGILEIAKGWGIIGTKGFLLTQGGTPNAIAPHDIPMALLGTFILAFGWFGFNPGNTLAGTDLRIAVVAVNTMLASATGAITAMFIMWKLFGHPDPSMTANGMLAGLVAITAPCAFVNAWAAVIIGIVAGALVVGSVFLVERVLKVDDPVGAVSVHGANGLWGVISLGLFADGSYGTGWNGVTGTVKGLFYGDPRQFLVQLIGAVTCIVFIFTLSYLFFKLQDKLMGIRVSRDYEIAGLDIPEMGIAAYDDGE
jgi:ammonia channel protein AmtB